MLTKNRLIALAAMATIAIASCFLLGAADDVPVATAPDHPVGFFERHYVITEMIVVPLLALLIAGGMASNTTTLRIETRHQDFWGKPLGKSFTNVPVSKTPSSPQEIKNTLLFWGGIYLVLRLTCLSTFFSGLYQFIGSVIDIPFRRSHWPPA